jgi:predicted MFS family arabinose efflux permease
VFLTAASGLIAVGMGFNNPSLVSLISRLSSQDEQGGILGVSQSLASLARVLGPAWGGFVFDRFGIAIPFVVASALMFLAFILSVHGLRNVQLGHPVAVRGVADAAG